MLGLFIPPWVRALLPWAGAALAVLAILAAVWWIDHNAATRTRAQIEVAAARIENGMRAELRGVEQRAADREAQRAEALADTLAGIRSAATTIIKPTVERELTREVRFADPALGLTPVLLEQVNRARALGPCTRTAGGGLSCALPAAQPDP
jgi:hypothetical protein